MAALTTQNIVDAGTAPTFGAASTSDTASIGNGRNTVVIYRNASGTAEDITIVAPGNTDYGEPMPDKVVSVAAGAEAWIPLRNEYAGDGNLATITMADATSITVAVVRIS